MPSPLVKKSTDGEFLYPKPIVIPTPQKNIYKITYNKFAYYIKTYYLCARIKK